MKRLAGAVDALMLLTVLIWGVNFSVVKATFAYIPPLAFNAIRLVGSSALLLGFTCFDRKSRFSPRELARVAALGLVGHTVYQLCFIFGLHATTASNSALLLGTTPIAVALVGAATGVERTQARAWTGILTSLAGVYLLIGRSRSAGGSATGDALSLAATFCWAIYTVGSKELLERHGALKVTAYSMASGTLIFLPLGFPSLLRLRFGEVPLLAWLGVTYSFVFALAAAYFIWYHAVSRIGPTRTAVYSNLTPVAAMFVSWLALGEKVGPAQLAGAAVIFLGIYLVRRPLAGREKVASLVKP